MLWQQWRVPVGLAVDDAHVRLLLRLLLLSPGLRRNSFGAPSLSTDSYHVRHHREPLRRSIPMDNGQQPVLFSRFIWGENESFLLFYMFSYLLLDLL